MKDLNRHIRAVAYTRVSTKRDEQDKSYKNQEDYYKYLCEEQGYNLVATYADKGSGTNSSRPEFLKMLYDAGIDAVKLEKGKDYNYIVSKRKPLFDLIICKDTSRFARNASEGITLVKRLRKLGVHIYFESRYASTKDVDLDEQINQWFLNGENESKYTSRRIKTTLRYNKERGLYTSGALPYALYRDSEGSIQVNEAQARVVKEVFELSKTLGNRRVAQILNEKGYETLTGANWGASQVRAMLNNTLYYGTAMSGKTVVETLTENPKSVPIEEQTPIPNQCTAIITKEEYDLVQEILAKRVTNKEGKRKGTNIPKEHDIFSKKISCGKCGGAFSRGSKPYPVKSGHKKRYYYYYCLRRNKSKVCDNSRHLPLSTLIKAITMVSPMIIVGEKTQDKWILREIDKAKILQKNIETDYRQRIKNNEIEIEEKTSTLGKLKLDNVIAKVESQINELIETNIALRLKIDKMKIVNLDGMIQRVEERVKEMERMARSLTDEDKLNLVKDINVKGFEYTFTFDVPNFNDIINELNSFMETNLSRSTYFEDMFNTFTVREVDQKLEVDSVEGRLSFFIEGF